MEPAKKAVVGVVAALCMISLIIVLENLLKIPAGVISRDMIVYVVVYFGFISGVNFTKEDGGGSPGRRPVLDNPWTWSAIALGITLVIIALYAFW